MRSLNLVIRHEVHHRGRRLKEWVANCKIYKAGADQIQAPTIRLSSWEKHQPFPALSCYLLGLTPDRSDEKTN